MTLQLTLSYHKLYPMLAFQTDRKQYIRNQIVRLQIIFLIALIVLLNTKPSSRGNAASSILFILLVSITGMLRQYHVKNIKIDKANDKLYFQLSSILSGKKEKVFNLSESKSRIETNSWFNRILSGPKRLVVYLPNNQFFSISSRYGFSQVSLHQIENELN
jgi:hypothetical protein